MKYLYFNGRKDILDPKLDADIHTQSIIATINFINRFDPVIRIEGRTKNKRIALLPFSVRFQNKGFLCKINEIQNYAEEIRKTNPVQAWEIRED